MLSFRSRGRHGDRPSGGLSSSVLLRVGGWGGLRWWCSAPACAQRPWILSSLTAWPGDACAVDPTQPPRAPGLPPVPAARFLLLACTPGPWLRLACFPWRPASRPPLPPRAMCLDIRSWWPGPSLQPGSWLPARWAGQTGRPLCCPGGCSCSPQTQPWGGGAPLSLSVLGPSPWVPRHHTELYCML